MIRTVQGHLNVDMETIINVLTSNNVNIATLKTFCGEQVDFSKEPPPPICNICWEIIQGLPSQHLSSTHPSCYCTDKNFQNIDELLEHFKTHNLRSQSCPVCPVKFENLFDTIQHVGSHKSSMLHPKPKCDNDLGLPLCAALDVDGFEHLQHILMFHITDREFLRSVLKKFVETSAGLL